LLGAPLTGDARPAAPNPSSRVAAPEEVAAFVAFDGGFTAQ